MKQLSVDEGSFRRPFQILLVEDSPTDIFLATEALDDAQGAHNLHVVRDGVAATAFLYRDKPYADVPRPDLILLDLNLPRKDGRELLAEIKADPSVKEIPVVVLTTSNADEDVVKSYENHANCYITKPVDFEHFTKIVKKVVSFWFAIVTLPPRSS